MKESWLSCSLLVMRVVGLILVVLVLVIRLSGPWPNRGQEGTYFDCVDRVSALTTDPLAKVFLVRGAVSRLVLRWLQCYRLDRMH